MKLKDIISLFKEAFTEFMDDGGGEMAASMTYYAIFSLFPLLLASISIASLLLDRASAQDYVLGLVGPVLPQSESLVAGILDQVIAQRGTIVPLALVSLIWSGTQLFTAIITVVNKAWDVRESRGFFAKLAVRFALFTGIGVLFILSFGMTAVAGIASRWNNFVFGIPLFVNPAWGLIVALLPFIFSFLLFLIIYKFAPNRAIVWTIAGAGAIVAALLFEIGKVVFVVYVERIAGYSLVYGPIAGVIVLLYWVYVSASILIYGVEIAKVYAEFSNKKTVVPPRVKMKTI